MNNLSLNSQYLNKPNYTSKLKNLGYQSASLNKSLSNNKLAFKAAQTSIPTASLQAVQLRTTLDRQDEQEKFSEIRTYLLPENKKALDNLLKTGRLLDNKSNDRSTTLDNLYKFLERPRVLGLGAQNLLNELVLTLNNPFVITQKFGDIPEEHQQSILDYENNRLSTELSTEKNLINLYKNRPQYQEYIKPQDLNVTSNCCVAASIEFNIAHRSPAEFARMAESLTSEALSVEKIINPNVISENFADSIWLLNEFATPHELKGWDSLKVKLQPDRNAIIRARVQNSYKDAGERSSIDVLMQSMLMHVGSQQTYNSLTDKRTGKFNEDSEGLTNIEKNYAESLATGNATILVTYQNTDENGKFIGHECDLSTIKQHISDTLNLGQNVIIGYTYIEADGTIVGGHEITIVGIQKDKNGQEFFVCKDTDNNSIEPCFYLVDEFLPRIHHAGVPKKVLSKDVEFVEGWIELLNYYKQIKNQPNLLNNNMSV